MRQREAIAIYHPSIHQGETERGGAVGGETEDGTKDGTKEETGVEEEIGKEGKGESRSRNFGTSI